MIIENNKKMNKGSIDKTTEHLPYSELAKIFSLIAFTTVIVFLILWLIFGLKVYLILFLCSGLGFLYFLFTAFYLKKICIKGNNITFIYLIGKPSTTRISESLYQIVMKNGKIRSFRFKAPSILDSQVSPYAYTNGGILLSKIMKVFKKKEVIVQIIEK